MNIKTRMCLLLCQLASCLTTDMEGGCSDLGLREDGAESRIETGGGMQISDEINRGGIM